VFKVLNEQSDLLGLQVSWVKTKIQPFNDIMDAAILSAPVCGEDVEVRKRFTFPGSDIHISAGCEPEVNRCLCRAWGAMDSLDQRLVLSEPVQEDKSPSLQVLGASSLPPWM